VNVELNQAVTIRIHSRGPPPIPPAKPRHLSQRGSMIQFDDLSLPGAADTLPNTSLCIPAITSPVPELTLLQHVQLLEKLLLNEKSTIDTLSGGAEIFSHLESIKKLVPSNVSSVQSSVGLKVSSDSIKPPENKREKELVETRPRAHSQSRPFSLFNVSLTRSAETSRDQISHSDEHVSCSDDSSIRTQISKRKSISRVAPIAHAIDSNVRQVSFPSSQNLIFLFPFLDKCNELSQE
jgi:hypothetical protein